MSGGRSIYDGDEDDAEEAPWFLRSLEDEDAHEDGLPDGTAIAAPGHAGDSGFRGGIGPEVERLRAAAEASAAASAGALYDIGRLVGRLEETVRAGAPITRLRAMEVSDLMWRAGRAVRAERVALYEIDGGVARFDNPEDYGLAAWALRRLRAPLDLSSPETGPETGPETVRAWLNRRARDEALGDVAATGHVTAESRALDDLIAAPDPGEADRALDGWLAAHRALADLPPPVSAGALAALWSATPAFGPERAITARLLGARLAARGADLPFIPLSIGAARGGRAPTDTRGAVDAFLADLHRALQRTLTECARLAVWRQRAETWAAAQKGRVAAALVGPLADNLALSAADAAGLADCTTVSAATKLAAFAEAGLAREITGQASWRFWTAKI